MKTILITGGAGFIASNLADKLSLTYNVVVADNLSTSKIANLTNFNKKNFYKIDVNNFKLLKRLFNKYKFDYVFHYAAVVGVKRTISKPLKVLEDIDGFKNIFILCKEYKVKRIFFSSSSEVYGEPVQMPQNEEFTPLNSKLPYAVVKNIGESFCRSFFHEHKLNYTIFRFFNTYGPRQSKDFVISKFINNAKKNIDINIYGDGLQSRTFCYIDDNIDSTINALHNNMYINKTINIGNEHIISIKNLAKKIIKLTNSKSKIKFIKPLKEGDMHRRQPDISKMKKLLGRELIDLDQGLAKII